MLTENQIVLARNWVFTRPTSHHHDGYERLRKYMILAGVNLPVVPDTKNPSQTERFLLLVYFDALEDLFRDAQEAAVA
jgi:hypothetical protein